ncbi:MAG: TAXI family TRAP transporter solute-binding subunit [Bacteroidetes bacterium]|nr:TAXI family TRAP transporter solute-binding subunit [Bacteroidota bacterium]
MKRGILIVIIGIFQLLLSGPIYSQVDLLTGFLRGSYYEMGNDIKAVSGPVISYDTIFMTTWNGDDSISLDRQSVNLVNLYTSKGSQHNFNRLSKSDQCYVAFMQYDVLINEQLKDIRKYSKRTDSILVLLPLGLEEIHCVTLKENKIKNLSNLKKKRVAIGAEGQGTQVTTRFIKEKTGIEWIDFELSFKDAMPALLNKKIDAFFFVGSAPVISLNSLSPTFEKLMLVPITDERLVDYYVPTSIPAGSYHWLKQDVETFGVKLILISDVSKEKSKDKTSIKRLIREIQSNIGKLQDNGHPNWKKVDFNFSEIKWEIHPISENIFGL